jgi:hypothetical protein
MMIGFTCIPGSDWDKISIRSKKGQAGHPRSFLVASQHCKPAAGCIPDRVTRLDTTENMIQETIQSPHTLANLVALRW